jgi:hypothetical protein
MIHCFNPGSVSKPDRAELIFDRHGCGRFRISPVQASVLSETIDV